MKLEATPNGKHCQFDVTVAGQPLQVDGFPISILPNVDDSGALPFAYFCPAFGPRRVSGFTTLRGVLGALQDRLDEERGQR